MATMAIRSPSGPDRSPTIAGPAFDAARTIDRTALARPRNWATTTSEVSASAGAPGRVRKLPGRQEKLADGDRHDAEPHAGDAEQLPSDLSCRGPVVVEAADPGGLGEEALHLGEVGHVGAAGNHEGEIIPEVGVLVAAAGL